MPRKDYLLPLLLVFLISSGLAALSAEPDQMTLKARHHAARSKEGTPITILAEISSPSPVSEANLFFRTLSTSPFAQIPMSTNKSSQYEAVIPGNFVASDVEYFVEARNASGQTAYFPGPAAGATSTVPVLLDSSPPMMGAFSPRPGETISRDQAKIAIAVSEPTALSYSGLDLGSIRMYIDGGHVVPQVDILSSDRQYRVTGVNVRFDGRDLLAPGVHRLAFTMRDLAGNSIVPSLQWTIIVTDDASYEGSGALPTRRTDAGSLSLSVAPSAGDLYLTQPSMLQYAATTFNVQGKLNDSTVVEGEVNFANSGNATAGMPLAMDSYTRYLQSRNLDRYSASFRSNGQELSIGTRYAEFPYQILSNPSFAGVSYKYTSDKGGLNLYLTLEPDHAPLMGYVYGAVNANIYEQNRMGARLSYVSPRGNETSLSLLRTENKTTPLQGMPGGASTMDSTILALNGKLYLTKNKDFRFQYLFATSFENYGAAYGSRQNSAMNFSFDGYLGRKLSFSAGYNYVEPYFGLLSASGQDRREFDVRATYYLSNHVNLGVNLSSGSDNVLNTKSATTYNRNAGYSLNINLPKMPSFTISGNHTRYTDDANPTLIDMESRSFNISSSYFTPRLTATAFLSSTSTLNHGNPTYDFDNTSLNLDCSYALNRRLSLRASYGKSINRYVRTGVVQEGESPAFGIVYTFKPDALAASLLYSQNSTRDNTWTTDNVTRTWSLLFDVTPKWKGKQLGSRLLIGADLINFFDSLNPANNSTNLMYRLNWNLAF